MAMKPIIVVGAGPVGLTTALGLDFYGFRAKLAELGVQYVDEES